MATLRHNNGNTRVHDGSPCLHASIFLPPFDINGKGSLLFEVAPLVNKPLISIDVSFHGASSCIYLIKNIKKSFIVELKLLQVFVEDTQKYPLEEVW